MKLKKEDDLAKPRSISLSDKDWQALKRSAEKEQRTVSDIVRLLIKKAFKR